MDGFIDGIIAIKIDDPTWVERDKNTVFIVTHTMLRPLQNSYPLSIYWSISLSTQTIRVIQPCRAQDMS